MSEERNRGTISNFKTTTDEAVGRPTGDEEREAEGAFQQDQGDAQKRLGDVHHDVRGDSGRQAL